MQQFLKNKQNEEKLKSRDHNNWYGLLEIFLHNKGVPTETQQDGIVISAWINYVGSPKEILEGMHSISWSRDRSWDPFFQV